MRIDIKRTGGFAGFDQHLATIDSTTLLAVTAAQLHQRVSELPAAGIRTTHAADLITYQLDVEAPGAPPRHIEVLDDGRLDAPGMAHVRAILALAGVVV